MLAIRMQRNGRKGHAYFKVIVQESRLSPTSGRVVAYVGSYDPHSKSVELNNEKIAFYLSNGAQPSQSVAKLFRSQKVDMPAWVNITDGQARTVRNPDKLRKNQTPEPEAPADETVAEEVVNDAEAAEETVEAATDEAPKEAAK